MRRMIVIGGTVLALACSTEPDSPIATEPLEVAPDPEVAPRIDAAPAWTPLVRGQGHEVRITEVWPDERASAALSLDGFGQVRLWPTLAWEAEFDELAPIRLPIHEPGWLSFARTSEGFMIATIDTARTGRVLEVRVDGAGEAQMLERFTTLPTDPLLELHVLAGGERLLALGVDHRIRLYDGQGKPLDELREHGFIPWQLRVQANRIVAVLGGPTRVQTLELRDDRLARVGELRTTLLDRGANLNDLQLTPDGQRVAVFRRKDSQSRKWSLQLIDLDDGEVRLLTGKVVGDIRPRVHLVDDRRALLEDGTGVGYWIDLDQGVARQPGFVPPEDFDDLPNAAQVEARRVPLVHSIGRERWHASVVAGIRVVPGGHQLVLDELDAPDHRRLGHTRVEITGAALSNDGSRVAWLIGEAPHNPRILIDQLSEPALPFEVPASDNWYEIVAFIDDEHLLLSASKRETIVAWRTGEIVDESVDNNFSMERVGVRASASGGLEYALSETGGDLVLIVDRRFVATDPATSHGWTWNDDRNMPSGLQLEGVVAQMAPSPCGRWLAIVEDDSLRAYGTNRFIRRDIRVAVHALGDAGETPREVWTMPVIDHESGLDLAWSADGERLAITERSAGGSVVTPTGEVVFERRHGELVDVRVPDEPR